MSAVPIRAAKDAAIERAIDAAERLDWPAAARQLAQSGKLRQNLGVWLKEAELPDEPVLQSQLTASLDRALALVAGLRLEATANRSELVAGEKFTVTVTWQRRAEVPLELGEPELVLPEGWKVTEKTADERGPDVSARGGVRFTVQIPADAKKPEVENEWMYPWPPALVRARLKAKLEGYEFAVEEDVTSQRVTTTRVDDLPLTLVPAVTLTPEPRQFVVAQNQPQKPLELVARVRHYGSAPAEVTVAVDAPGAWRASQPVRLQFDGAGDQLVKFTVTPPRAPPVGSFPLKLVARVGRREFRTSLEPLVTLPTRLWSEPAVANVRVFDVNVPRGLRVGYVAAENDPIPASLRQLGIEVTMLDEAALAFGDLGRFDAIAIGIRAYELREDLIRSNRRLLDYCAAGGTLLVQYQR
ncbi:MAG: NEW3 domain-containing protein, partial [Candidatus Acidiferrales bacterium]